ncbi:MAG: hypothetical protein JO356_19610 [Acidobacteria bacterium]|nr:hypothetical protein [Acidobacteriota bacterium]
MKNPTIFRCVLAGLALSLPALGQSAKCLDASAESHHQVLYESQGARVLLLDLPRIASTQPYCYARPYLFVVTGAGKSSSTPEGSATYSHDWNGPEARFIYTPLKHVLRNESMVPFRAVIVETFHQVDYDPMQGNYDVDLFPSDFGSVKPTWTVSFTRGTIGASKTQLAPGDSTSVVGTNSYHLLIALTEVSLAKESPGGVVEQLQLGTQEVRMLPPGPAFQLSNEASQPARFVMIEF